MTTQEVAQIIPTNFHAESRVWIYQSSRAFIEKEQKEINEQLEQFYTQWLAHGEQVNGWAKLLFNQFIVVMADKTGAPVSGCSTDGMEIIIKSIGRQYSVNFFDRMTLTFLRDGKAEMLPFNQVQYALDRGMINADTLTFNNIATTKNELLTTWLVPMKESWLKNRVRFGNAVE